MTKIIKVRMFIVNNLELTFYPLTVRKLAALQVIITKHKQPPLSFYSQHSGQQYSRFSGPDKMAGDVDVGRDKRFI